MRVEGQAADGSACGQHHVALDGENPVTCSRSTRRLHGQRQTGDEGADGTGKECKRNQSTAVDGLLLEVNFALMTHHQSSCCIFYVEYRESIGQWEAFGIE